MLALWNTCVSLGLRFRHSVCKRFAITVLDLYTVNVRVWQWWPLSGVPDSTPGFCGFLDWEPE